MGFVALIITLLVILFAIKTKKCTECLYLGALIASLIFFRKDFLTGFLSALVSEVSGNTWLWLMTGLFGALIALIKKAGGVYGFSRLVSKLCRSDRSCYLTTFLIGIIIFIDDYLNVLTVGLCMKKTFDQRKIPREALAYLADCTGTPVCTLIPVSSWAAFYGTLFMGYSVISNRYSGPITAYCAIIPYLFYPIITLFVLLLFCLGLFPKIGPMKEAYKKAGTYLHKEGTVDKKEGNILDFLAPMALMIIVSIASGEILAGIISAIILCFVLYVPRKIMKVSEFTELIIEGFSSMVGVIILLAGCYTFKNICSQMGMTDFIIEKSEIFMKSQFIPLICFALSAFLSFSTSTVWGTSALVVPMLIPVIQALNAPLQVSLGALVSGGVFGAQACVYADSTVLTATGCGITNTEHAFSQMPYILIPAAVSSILYLICGFVF